MTFIKHGSTLINPAAIAIGTVGPVNARGSRPVTLSDSAGRGLGVIPYNKLDRLPGPGPIIGPLATELDGREGRWRLHDIAREAGQ